MALTRLATTAAGPRRSRRTRIVCVGSGLVAVLLGALGIRLWMTYLPPVADATYIAAPGMGPSGATVQSAPVDLPQLEERARRTAQAVLPSVVAVTNPFGKTSDTKRYRGNSASGVIISADGIELSQWHVSHRKRSEDAGAATIQAEPSPTGSADDRTTVILHDGRELPAELLGANRAHDLSLLRLLEPGPYPHVPVLPAAPVEAGDWVLKIGHPLGFRSDRSAPVRLGRVLCGTDETFGTDCMVAGGDSGGPYFSLDGRLLGIVCRNDGQVALMNPHDADFTRRGGLSLWRVSGSKLIGSLLDTMRRGEISPDNMEERARVDHELLTSKRLQTPDYAQGSATLAQYRSVVEPARSSVVVVLNAGVAIALGTIVSADGWVVTKASELPAHPACRLPDGKVVPARVVSVDQSFDVALLSVPAAGLKPIRWADDFNPPVGTLLAAVGTERPLAVGIVSVPRRDLSAPARPNDVPTPPLPTGRPKIYGRSRPIPGYSLRAALWLPRATAYQVSNVFDLADSAGVRPNDHLYSINGRRILAETDINEAVAHLRAGDVVPVRLERAGETLDLQLPLGPETPPGTNSRADDFPTVIECAVPFYPHECGGPIVNRAGRAIGITIARPGPHGGMIIPGDCILKLIERR